MLTLLMIVTPFGTMLAETSGPTSCHLIGSAIIREYAQEGVPAYFVCVTPIEEPTDVPLG